MGLNVEGLSILGAGESAKDYGRWLIHGEQGSGKTSLAATIAETGKTLFVDFVGEKGTRSFQGAPFASNIDVVRPTSVGQIDDLLWELNAGGHGYKSLVIDSLTSLQHMAMRFSLGISETTVKEMRQGGGASPEFKNWGQTADILRDVGTFGFSLADGTRKEPMHVVMTAQTEMKENEVTGDVTRTPVIQRGALPIVLAACDYLVYTEVEENLDAVGDDSEPPVHYIMRFGSHPGYRTKARLPYELRGKMPSILGRRSAPNLTSLSRALQIGGVPSAQKKTTKESD